MMNTRKKAAGDYLTPLAGNDPAWAMVNNDEDKTKMGVGSHRKRGTTITYTALYVAAILSMPARANDTTVTPDPAGACEQPYDGKARITGAIITRNYIAVTVGCSGDPCETAPIGAQRATVVTTTKSGSTATAISNKLVFTGEAWSWRQNALHQREFAVLLRGNLHISEADLSDAVAWNLRNAALRGSHDTLLFPYYPELPADQKNFIENINNQRPSTNWGTSENFSPDDERGMAPGTYAMNVDIELRRSVVMDRNFANYLIELGGGKVRCF
ncbi:hypothetical protein M1O70_001804 [Salmonella enterica]|nr:hypothetical protein [Salmonella enterica]